MAVAPVRRRGGQVLVLYALVLPLLLVPVVGYGVDSALIAARQASLQAATAEAAEIAAQRIDIDALRATGTLALDRRDLGSVLTAILAAEEPNATVDSLAVAGAEITVLSSEMVELPVPVLARSAIVRAHATARVVPGYDSPSSFFPLSSSTF